jgi:hypothetical protein
MTLIGAATGANAAITPYQNGGESLVYSSFSNITWTQNGNLLGDWITADGMEAVFEAISSVSPTVTVKLDFSPPEAHTLTLDDFRGDFGNRGRATLYGAYAFIAYLNSINYAGTDQWRLPSANNGVYANPAYTGYVKTGEFGQLYYDELGATAGFGIYTGDPELVGNFTGITLEQYWSDDPVYVAQYGVNRPFGFYMGNGSQYNLNPTFEFYVMPVTSGMVPEPATVACVAVGLIGLMARRGRRLPSA